MTRPALKDIVMRPTVWIPPAAAAVLVGVLVVDPPAERQEPARVVRRVGSGPDVDGPVGGFTGKPNPALGALVLEVTERPSPDRAVVRARWARAEGAHGCSLDLLVPEGATLLEGKPQVVIGDDEVAGEASWLLDFPTDRDLDLVARFCGTNDRGDEAMEAVVQLVVAKR